MPASAPALQTRPAPARVSVAPPPPPGALSRPIEVVQGEFVEPASSPPRSAPQPRPTPPPPRAGQPQPKYQPDWAKPQGRPNGAGYGASNLRGRQTTYDGARGQVRTRPYTPRTAPVNRPPIAPKSFGAGGAVPGLLLEAGLAEGRERQIRELYARDPEAARRDADEVNDRWRRSPFNPFGDMWRKAPWNDPDSKNSLNPGPRATSPDIGPDDFWPVANPPSAPIRFRVELKAQLMFAANGNASSLGDQYFYREGYGIPIGWRTTPLPAPQPVARYEFLVKDAQGQVSVFWGETLATGPYRDGSPSGYSADIQRTYLPASGDSGLAQKTEPLKIPDPQYEPFDHPYWQPTNRPEVPVPTIPFAPPRSAPQIGTRTRPQPKPLPAPDPTIPQPQPIPQPQRDPLAPSQPAPLPTTYPDPIPRPWLDPWGDPDVGPLTNPAPAPSAPSSAPNRRTTTYNPTDPSNQPKLDPIPLPWLKPVTIPVTPKPAPEFDLCQDPCIHEMHEGMKTETISYLTFTGCNTETGEPEFKTESIDVPANQATFTQALLDKLAAVEAQQCNPVDAYAAIPESYQLKLQSTPPQLVVQYAEYLGNNKYGPPKYSITIPHYVKTQSQTTKQLFPDFVKGNYAGILVLADNSKTVINAIDAEEAETAIDKIKGLIPSALRNTAVISITKRKGRALNQITVVPRIANYYEQGATAPSWRKYL